MKINPILLASILAAMFSVLIGLEAWTLGKVNKLSEDMAVVKYRLSIPSENNASGAVGYLHKHTKSIYGN